MPVAKLRLAFFVIVFFLVPNVSFGETRVMVFPVSGTYSFQNDFMAPRDNGARSHLGIDIIADKMTPLISVVDGTIVFIAIPQASWGYSLTIRDVEGYTYRYLHINNDTPGTDDGSGGEKYAYAEGIRYGLEVVRGQLLGWVGDSGNAESTVPHLHFEIQNPSRVSINPYDSLVAAAGGVVPIPVVTVQHKDENTLDAETFYLANRRYQEGMTNSGILSLHENLKKLGYYAGDITETYTSITRESVRKFQVDNGLFPNGIADGETLRKLEAEVLVPRAQVITAALSEGASGDAVRALQLRLKELGFFKADISGYFGTITKNAVISFQISRGIEPIGVVGTKTRAALLSATPQDSISQVQSTSTVPFSLTLNYGSRGAEVVQLQTVLKKLGYFSSETTGFFGLLTEKAVISFQKDKGLEPVGIVGPKTRALLNSL